MGSVICIFDSRRILEKCARDKNAGVPKRDILSLDESHSPASGGK